MTKKSIAIIGGGPASVMLACSLDKQKYAVSIYEKNNTLGRKFLVAGKGGFNLTHSENMPQFIERYTPKSFMAPFLKFFTNQDFRQWLRSIGIETYVGTSKRVFPVKGIKPIQVLNALEKNLKENHVSVCCNHEWKGWNQNNQLLFSSNNETLTIKPDITVFALGGASWKVTGSDGSWKNYFQEKGIQVNPFYPSNCGYKINWKKEVLNQIEGQALKNCEFACGNMKRKGEAVITQFGIEGSGVYPLSPVIRHDLLNKHLAELEVDFKPELSVEEIKHRFLNKGRQSIKDVLEKKLNLSQVQITIIKAYTSKDEYNNTETLIQKIKSFRLEIIDFAAVDEAISTVGGIDLAELDKNMELKKLPHHYCIGEMLDWDAPTGGYLLQGCFSMGYFLAKKLN